MSVCPDRVHLREQAQSYMGVAPSWGLEHGLDMEGKGKGS